MVVFDSKNAPTPTDIVFVVEGTALCGAYLNELKQAYIIPTLEHFNGGPVNEKECESPSNYAVYGLVVFHAVDILPGYLTDAYGPITTPYKLLTTLDKIQFTGGFGEAASHVGEGLATALQCLQDITDFRNPPLEAPAKKHVILISNCKPYGLPVTESVGSDGIYRGMTAEQLAEQMQEKGVHLSIMGPRKIPALISLFDRGGGESSSQKTYARDVRHLVLLSGFQLQERPITPKQVPDVPTPVMNPPPVAAPPPPVSQAPPPPVPTSGTQHQLPQSPSVSQPQQQIPNFMQQQHPQPLSQPPTPRPVAPTPPPPVQVPTPPVSSQGPMMSSPSPSGPPSSMAMQQQQQQQQQSNMVMSSATNVSMAQSQPGNPGQPMMMSQAPNNMGVGMTHMPPQQQQQQPNQHQQMILIRNRAPLQQMQNIRPPMQMQNQQQMNQNPNQMGQHGQPINQVHMNIPGGPPQQQQQLPPGQMLNSQQIMANQQVQMSMNQQHQQQQLNKQLNQQLQNPQQQQQHMNQPMNPQQMGQQYQNQQQLGQMNPQQQINQQMMGQQNQMTNPNLGPRPPMSVQVSTQQQQHQSQANQTQGPPPQQQAPPTSQNQNMNMGRWPGQQMSAASSMQQLQKLQQSQAPLRMANVNQPQVSTPTQSLQAQMTTQQPISSTGIQPSALQQQLQQNQPPVQQQQQQPPGHSTLLAQLKIPPQQAPPQPAQPQPQQQSNPSPLMVGSPGMPNQKERHTIWNGTLEWHEKQKGPPDGQKVPRQVPCKVFAYVVNGEPEVKGDGWPPKLIMQLIPKNIVGSLGGSFLVRDVKTVVFLLQNCDALNSLTRVMESGYAGCVHFTGAAMQQAGCNIKVLILLYSKERQTYLGFIPNDQVGFVDRIRKVIQQQKQQQTTRQVQGFPGPGSISPAGLMPGQQPSLVPTMVQGQQQQLQQPGLVQSQPGMLQGSPQQQPGLVQQQQQQQQGMVQPQQAPISSLAQQLAQTPQSSMGPSQVTAQLAQQLGQAQQLQQQLQRQQQQLQNPGMGGNPDSQNPAETQYEMERQQNLLAIQQLQQTLQAAQQKELQFQQLQHHPVPGPGGHQQQQPAPGPQQMQVQGGQQQQMMQQGLPGQQHQQQQQQLQHQQQVPRQMMTPQGMGQMRMMRTSVSQANPGLKHLLQQQPGPQNYRMQMPMQQQQQRMQGQMGMPMPGQMQGQGPGGPMQPNQQVSQFEDVGILDLLK